MFLLVIFASGTAQAALPEWLDSPKENVIVIGGTDDPQAKDQLGRMDGWTDDSHNVKVVEYPAEFFPIGKMPYDQSVEVGKANLRQEIEQTEGPKTVVGMSQSARIVGDVAEEYDSSENADDLEVILLADPRFPSTGAEEVLDGMSLLGATATGERQPTQYVRSTSVCIKGDPVCGMGGHPANILPGFICIHSGGCPGSNANYGHLDELEVSNTWQEGETTYVEMDAPHPWRIVAESAGVPVTDEQEEILHVTMPVPEPGESLY
jgi:hypothetical protein